MKYLLLKSQNEPQFREALLTWRNTPRQDGIFPAQLVFGFTLNFGQTIDFKPNFINRDEAKSRRNNTHAAVAKYSDASSVTRDILKLGSNVRVHDPKTKRWTITGKIIEVRDDYRSYLISCDDDTMILQNRRFIKLIPAS